jgi:hypothetical protein
MTPTREQLASRVGLLAWDLSFVNGLQANTLTLHLTTNRYPRASAGSQTWVSVGSQREKQERDRRKQTS